MEDKLKICRHKPHPRFLANGLSSCILEPKHEGGHVYYVHISKGIDPKSCAGEFFLELDRTTLKPVIRVDLRGNQGLTNEEAAVMYAFFFGWSQKEDS